VPKQKTFKQKTISLLEKAEAIKKRGPRRVRFFSGKGKDSLASGAASSATYSGYDIDQQAWDAIWDTDKDFRAKYHTTKAEFHAGA